MLDNGANSLTINVRPTTATTRLLCPIYNMPAVEMSIRVYENSVLKVLPRVVSTKVSTKYRDTFGIAIPKSIEAYSIPVS